VAEVRRGSLEGLAGVTGITRPFRSATAAAEVGARVVERHVEPGQDVDAGDPLVSLDDTHLSIAVDEARAALNSREVDLAEARRELTRGEELVSQGAISDGRHDNLRFAAQRARSARELAAATLRKAERAKADAVVRAPFAGTVERVDVQVGDVLAPGAPVAQIADFDRVRMVAGVTAAEAAELQPGITATVSIPALSGYRAAAPIHSVGQMADPKTGTYPVELWLDNAERRIREGMVGQLELVIAPRAAILRKGGLAVYVVEERDGQARAVARPVRTGRAQGDLIELLEGVDAGERVVVEGQFALVDGASVFVDEASSSSATCSST
jgi:RND family efflux transporter MFP subunit